MSKEMNFGYLGPRFQQSLLKTIIEDKKFGDSIVEVIESNYFDGVYFRVIMEHIKELYITLNSIPAYETIKNKILIETKEGSSSSKVIIDTLSDIQTIEINDALHIQGSALNFCKQQVLKKALKEVEAITNDGEFEAYKRIENIIQKALQVGVIDHDMTDIFDDVMSALQKDCRTAIPTGVVGVDNLLKGGLGRGELGVVLAPTGTGKTTLLTKFANAAFNNDFNVVQIFFEDNVNNIKRKHFTIWSGIAPDDQTEVPEEVEKRVNEAKERSKGQIRLLKLPSDSVTVSEIKSKLRKMIADGFKIDLLTLDYVDCISPERSAFGEEWKGEGAIMRQLESMTSEFDIAIWTATQGNRESIKSEVVTTDQMGGSIKKAQIGHVVLSIGKTLQQKELNLATLTLLKSRVGRDGVIFDNCHFNNEYLTIDTDSQSTMLGFEQDKEEKNKQRIRKLLDEKTKTRVTN
jgi:replicative DNA helicase